VRRVATVVLRLAYAKVMALKHEAYLLMTPGKIPWLALAIVALLWAAQGCSTQQPEKSTESVLDYSQPVYIIDHAIVFPGDLEPRLTRPVLNPEAGNPAKLTLVIGNKDQFASNRLRCNKRV
jgi:hypothetical protein